MHCTYFFEFLAVPWNAAKEMKSLSVGAHHTDPKNPARELLPVVLALGKN